MNAPISISILFEMWDLILLFGILAVGMVLNATHSSTLLEGLGVCDIAIPRGDKVDCFMTQKWVEKAEEIDDGGGFEHSETRVGLVFLFIEVYMFIAYGFSLLMLIRRYNWNATMRALGIKVGQTNLFWMYVSPIELFWTAVESFKSPEILMQLITSNSDVINAALWIGSTTVAAVGNVIATVSITTKTALRIDEPLIQSCITNRSIIDVNCLVEVRSCFDDQKELHQCSGIRNACDISDIENISNELNVFIDPEKECRAATSASQFSGGKWLTAYMAVIVIIDAIMIILHFFNLMAIKRAIKAQKHKEDFKIYCPSSALELIAVLNREKEVGNRECNIKPTSLKDVGSMMWGLITKGVCGHVTTTVPNADETEDTIKFLDCEGEKQNYQIYGKEEGGSQQAERGSGKRNAMFPVDYNGASRKNRSYYFSCLKKLPVPSIFPFSHYFEERIVNDEPIGEIPQRWDEDAAVCDKRLIRGQVDRSFTLLKTQNEKFLEELNIGRMWRPRYDGVFRFVEGYEWGSKRLALQPAFAALAEDNVEKQSIAARTALMQVFMGSRSENFTDDARSAIISCVNSEFNAVRYIYRLCAMYMGAKLLELEGGRLSIDDIRGPAEKIGIDRISDFNSILTSTVANEEQVIYVEMDNSLYTNRMALILYAAASEKPIFREAGGSSNVPKILSFWPEIGKAKITFRGRGTVQIVQGRVDSNTIWLAIEMFVKQYALFDVYEEVIKNIATWSHRPEGEKAYCGHRNVKIALPKSRMSAGALGPIVYSVRNFERETRYPVQPDLSKLLWEGTARYAAWALATKDILRTTAANTERMERADNRSIVAIESMVRSCGSKGEIQLVIEKYMEFLGWKNGLGRDLRSVVGLDKRHGRSNIPMQSLIPITSSESVQWEEVVPYVDELPSHASIASLLYPVAPTIEAPIARWITAKRVENRIDNIFSYMSMANVGVNKFGYVCMDVHSGESKIRKYNPMMSYRGEIADGEFCSLEPSESLKMLPVFRVNTAGELMNVWAKAKEAMKCQWFINAYKSESIDYLINELSGAGEEEDQEELSETYGKIEFIDLEEQYKEAQRKLDEEDEGEGLGQVEYPEKMKAAYSAPHLPIGEMGVMLKVAKIKKMVSPKSFEKIIWVQSVINLKNRKSRIDVDGRLHFSTTMVGIKKILDSTDVRNLPLLVEKKENIPEFMMLLASMIREFVLRVEDPIQENFYMRTASEMEKLGMYYKEEQVSLDTFSDLQKLIDQKKLGEFPAHVNSENFSLAKNAGVGLMQIQTSSSEDEIGKLIAVALKKEEEAISKAFLASIKYERRLYEYKRNVILPLDSKADDDEELEKMEQDKIDFKVIKEREREDEIQPEVHEGEKTVTPLQTEKEKTVSMVPVEKTTDASNFGGAPSLPGDTDTGPTTAGQSVSSVDARPSSISQVPFRGEAIDP